MVLVIRRTRSDRGASPGRVSFQVGCHGTPSTRGKAPTRRGRALKGLGASAGSVRSQQQPHQLDLRACPLDPLHGRGPSGLQPGGTSARRHHRPHPVPGRGRHRPRLARVPRIQQTRPRRGARPAMSPDDSQTRPPGAYASQSPRRCHIGPSGPPAVVHPQRLLAVADRLGRRGLLYPRITSHTPHVECARTPPARNEKRRL